jgi:hypothetical protein
MQSRRDEFHDEPRTRGSYWCSINPRENAKNELSLTPPSDNLKGGGGLGLSRDDLSESYVPPVTRRYQMVQVLA